MTTRLAVLMVALIGVASVAQAQSNPPLDPNGRPYVGAKDWHAGPGDYRPGMQPRSDQQAQAVPASLGDRHQTAFKDEYGFRYDSEGNLLDANGNVLPPPVTPPGAAASR